MLRRGPEEEFLGVQLVGADHEFIRRAADVVNEYEFSVVDFNLGCPVPKVAKREPGRNWDGISTRRWPVSRSSRSGRAIR